MCDGCGGTVCHIGPGAAVGSHTALVETEAPLQREDREQHMTHKIKEVYYRQAGKIRSSDA